VWFFKPSSPICIASPHPAPFALSSGHYARDKAFFVLGPPRRPPCIPPFPRQLACRSPNLRARSFHPTSLGPSLLRRGSTNLPWGCKSLSRASTALAKDVRFISELKTIEVDPGKLFDWTASARIRACLRFTKFARAYMTDTVNTLSSHEDRNVSR
jgi:hypothetical protein